MTRDYTKVPGYEGMTQPQARYNYLHDLLDAYMRLTPEDRTAMVPCKVREERGDCRYCSFSGFLGGDPEVCCAWRAEPRQDKAVEILEMLLKNVEKNWTSPTEFVESHVIGGKAIQIADHYGKEPQLGMAQEECAELIQAISKVRRNGETAIDMDNLAEELADVRIMCFQLAGLFGVTERLNQYARIKADRQLRRIEEEDSEYEEDEE